MSYLNDTFTGQIKEYVSEYYKPILNRYTKNHSRILKYSTIEYFETKYILESDKIRRLRELNLSLLEEEVENKEKILEEIEYIDTLKVKFDKEEINDYPWGSYEFSEISARNVTYDIPEFVNKKSIKYLDENSIVNLISSFISDIDKLINDDFKDIPTKVIDNESLLMYEISKFRHENNSGKYTVYGNTSYNKIEYKKLNLGFNKLLLTPNSDSLILNISDVTASMPVAYDETHFMIRGHYKSIFNHSDAIILDLSRNFFESLR